MSPKEQKEVSLKTNLKINSSNLLIIFLLLFKINNKNKKMIWPFRRKSKKRIARIVIEEPITSSTRVSTLKALKQVEEREFPGLILRIDSPGGTVGDSQEIYSAINRLKSKGCKVVASFGNISASGGVYIGVAADKIVANPGTITGSIGVIIRGNNISELLSKIGIKFETVKSGLFKDILSPDKPLSEEGRALLQNLIDESYEQFTNAVSVGRKIPIEDVKKFADGRIFTGSQAKELGLVDEIGDEYKAREIASEMTDTDLKIEPLTIGKKKKKILGLIPGSELAEKLINLLSFEIETINKLLWLYKS